MMQISSTYERLRACPTKGTTAAETTSGVFDGRQGGAVDALVNGGFEKPVVASGRYRLFSTGQTFAGWCVVGARGSVARSVAPTSFVARSGKQWIDLTGLSQTATGIAQTVKTRPGRRYTLRFAVGVGSSVRVFLRSGSIDFVPLCPGFRDASDV